MSAPGRTTSLVNAAIAEFGFEPCREEKCRIPALHAKHESHNRQRANSIKKCPLCRTKLTRPAPRKRAYCPNAVCGWRRTECGLQQEQTNA